MKPSLSIIALPLLCAISSAGNAQVKATVEQQQIPTYKIGAPEEDPIFFTGRVYQGAEGYIYPYQLYDRLTDERTMKTYDILKLGNEWVDIGIMPEIG